MRAGWKNTQFSNKLGLSSGISDDPYYQLPKCSQMTLLSGIKVHADIRGGSLGMGRQRTVGLSTTAIFSVFAGYFCGNFRDEASVIIHSDMESLVGFFTNPKCVTLNDLAWLFRVKLCFRAGLSSVGHCDFRK